MYTVIFTEQKKYIYIAIYIAAAICDICVYEIFTVFFV
jgi:hypothetical protein